MALSLLDSVIAGFFADGEMPIVTAYAFTVLAKSYIEDSLGIDQPKQLTTMFENANGDELTFMVPEDSSIQKQIRGLEELKSGLICCPVSKRDTMIFH